MSTLDLGVADQIPAEVPEAAPARPRLVLIATAFAVLAFGMFLAGLFAVYVSQRAAFGEGWIPDGAGTIPLAPASVMLATMAMSSITVQWAVYAIARNDRLNSYLAAGLSFFFAIAFLNQGVFLFKSMGWEILGDNALQATLINAIAGTQFLMLVIAMVYLAVATFRSLAGQYSARDHEGMVGAAMFWHAAVIAYAVIWAAIYNIK
ncbi:MAG: cytochrome c oxidase subunit 3 [Acidimicrobiia bacterium]